MSLNLIAFILSGWAALMLFVGHLLTSPHRQHWVTVPAYLRAGLFVTGALFMVVSVCFTKVPEASDRLRQIYAVGILGLGGLAYCLTACMVFILSRTFPPRIWVRLEYITRLVRCPTPTRRGQDALGMLAMQGAMVIPPGGGVDTLIEAVDQSSHSSKVDGDAAR